MKNKKFIHAHSILKKSFLIILIFALAFLFCANSFASRVVSLDSQNGNGNGNGNGNPNGPVGERLIHVDDTPISISVGETYTLRVTGGAPPFVAKDYDQSLIDVTPLDLHSFQITAKAAGSTRITVNDKKGDTLVSKNVTIQNKADKLAIVLDKDEIYVGDIVTPSISGGVPPYKLVIINNKIADLLPKQTNTFKFLTKAPGKTQLAFSDSSGQVVLQNITVLEKQKPVPPLTIKVTSQINTGESTTLLIDGGTPPYNVNVLNNKIVDITQTGANSFQITGKIPGTTVLTVSDIKGLNAQQAITVIEKSQPVPLSINLTAEQIQIGDPAILKVQGGTPPYGVNVLNSKIIDIVQTGADEFRITGKNIGITPLTIFDANRQSAQKTIQVIEKPVPVTPLTVNSLSEIRMGETTSLTISGGTPPYNVSLPKSSQSLQNLIIELVQTGSNSYQIKGKLPGAVILTITDSKGQSAIQRISVVQRILPLTANIPPEVNLGESVTLSVIGGDPPYNVNPSNAFVSVLKTDNNNFQIKGLAVGKTILVVYDKRGQRVVKTISVVQQNQFPLTITNLPQEIYVGDSATMQVIGGTPPYNFSVPNNFIIDYLQVGSNLFQIKAKSPGDVQITIFDQSGQKIQKTLSVVEKIQPLNSNIVSEIYVGDQTTLTVDGGTPPYNVTMPNNKTITALQTGRNSFQIKGIAAGQIQVTIFDSRGQSTQQLITVLEKILPLAINLPSPNMKVGDTLAFTVTGGNPPYFVSVSDNSILSITQSGTNSFKITAKDDGKAMLKIYDSGKQSEFRTITVEKKPEVLNVVLPVSKINIGQTATFTVTGNPPYYMANLNPEITEITQLGSNSFSITGKKAGKGQFIIYDSADQNSLQTITVINPLALSISNEGAQAGNFTTLKVSGGTPPYYVSSPSSEISISQTGDSQFDISSSAYGDYKITVYDSTGQDASKNITFYPELLTTQLISKNIFVGKSTVIILSGGIMPYKVTAKDKDIIKIVPITEDIFLVTGLAPGDTKIQISDGFRWVKEESITVRNK